MTYLTERQRDILKFIRDFKKRKGVAPTHKEICEAFGFSSYGTVYKHLSLLEKKGLIRRDWNQKRGVELVEEEREELRVRELPLFGNIAAGLPLEVDQADEMIAVPDTLTSRGQNFVLKVRGDSMIDDGILDGDSIRELRGSIFESYRPTGAKHRLAVLDDFLVLHFRGYRNLVAVNSYADLFLRDAGQFGHHLILLVVLGDVHAELRRRGRTRLRVRQPHGDAAEQVLECILERIKACDVYHFVLL